MLKTRLGAVLLAGLLCLTACSSVAGGDAGHAADLDRAVPAEATGRGHHGPGKLVVEAAPAPAGFRTVRTTRSHIQFAAPSDWIEMNSDAMADLDAVREYAESAGVSPDQLRAFLEHVDVMVVGPGGDNINVVSMGALAEVPSNAALRSQLSGFHADTFRVRAVEVAAGPGRVAFYVLAVPGQPRQFGASLFVMTPDGVTNLTVTSASRAGTRHLVQQVLPTIAPLGNAGRV